MQKEKVVIIGGGFAGLMAAKELQGSEFDVLLVDRTNHHLFQPLLYQVATAALSPGDIAVPIRTVFSEEKNIEVILGEVSEIDIEKKIIKAQDFEVSYDYLIVATGAKHSYFGKDEWEKYAPGLKTVNDALHIREKFLNSLEEAEKRFNSENIDKYLNFVIVGGGPTGVELAGSITEIVNRIIKTDYHNISGRKANVYLVEAAPRVLGGFPEDLSESARVTLEKMGIKVWLNKRVTEINAQEVKMGDEFIETTNVLWAAGNQVSPLLKMLNVPTDRAGRVFVEVDLTIPGHPEIFVTGDAAAAKDEQGNFLPGIAPVAMQQGKYAAKMIRKRKAHNEREPFKYFDRGTMATIGKAKAVANIKGFKFSGVFAWLLWSLVHVMYLIGFRNRFRVMAEWVWFYFTSRPGIRLIVQRK